MVVVKTILYKRTIALGTRIDFRKDLRRSEPRGNGDGSGWRKKAVQTGGRIHNNTEKRRERSSLRAANGSRLTCTTSPPVNHSIIHSFVQSINRHFLFAQ